MPDTGASTVRKLGPEPLVARDALLERLERLRDGAPALATRSPVQAQARAAALVPPGG